MAKQWLGHKTWPGGRTQPIRGADPNDRCRQAWPLQWRHGRGHDVRNVSDLPGAATGASVLRGDLQGSAVQAQGRSPLREMARQQPGGLDAYQTGLVPAQP